MSLLKSPIYVFRMIGKIDNFWLLFRMIAIKINTVGIPRVFQEGSFHPKTGARRDRAFRRVSRCAVHYMYRGNEIRYVEGRVARPPFDGFRYDRYPKTRNSFLRDLLYK